MNGLPWVIAQSEFGGQSILISWGFWAQSYFGTRNPSSRLISLIVEGLLQEPDDTWRNHAEFLFVLALLTSSRNGSDVSTW
jgi:hypothetical protein